MRFLSVSALALCLAFTVQASMFFSNDDSELQAQWDKKTFAQPGHEYKFSYNAQLAAAYAPWVSTQASVLRISAPVHVVFTSERSAVLRIPEIRVGHMNDQIDSTQVQNMQLSESADINEQAAKALRLPVQFTLADGQVERVQFAKQDPTWSRNIKKAIVQLFQINLKKTSFQVVEQQTTEQKPRVFTETETNLEGECPVVYTVAQTGHQQWNVTKAVQFRSCVKLADSAYGYQNDQTQSQLRRNFAQQQQGLNEEAKKQMLQQPIPSEKLDRSTVYRYQLRADKDGKKIALISSELVSDYQIKSTKAENQNAQQVVALARLQLKSVEKTQAPKLSEKLEEEETLLYNTKYESDEKRFYMYGDEEFQTSPFEYEQSESARVQSIESQFKQIVEAFEKNPHESKQEIINKISEVLRQLRKCSLKTLKQIRKSQESTVEKELFDDLLAMAATRNPIALLAEQIPKMRTVQALKTLKSISGALLAPSERIAQHILDLCQKVDQSEQALHQSCWIAFSAVVGQLNQQQQQAKYSVVYPTQKEEMQMERKLQEYQQILEKKWTVASTDYERVLALKCLANAGLEKTLALLQKIIRNTEQTSFIRTEAIDALRRMRYTQPQRLQEILMPVFVNNREQPEPRMAALSLIISTLSVQRRQASPIIDQIMFTLVNERSEQVRAFTYSLCQSYAQSPVAFEQRVAEQMRQSLHISNLDEEEMLKRASRSIRVPIYSEVEREGLFIGANMAFSPESLLPTHVAAYVDTMLNGFVNKHSIYVSVCQQNVDQWIQRLVRKARSSVRSSTMKNAQELKRFLQTIKIEKRSEQTETPFAMLTIRVKDVDQVVLPMTNSYFTDLVEKAQSAQQFSDFFQISHNTEGRFRSLISAHECALTLPTATGFKIQVEQLVIALANGQAKADSTIDLKQHVKANVELNRAHVAVEHQQQMYIIDQLTRKSVGVSSHRTVELQTPKNFRFNIFASIVKGLKVEYNTPEQNVRVISIRSLPYTFVGYNQIRTVQNRQLLPLQREVNYSLGDFRFNGLVHKPLAWTRPAELLKTILTAENYLTVDYVPSQRYERGVTLKAHGFIFSPATLEESLAQELKNFAKEHRQVSRSNQWNNAENADYDNEYDAEEQERADKYMTDYQSRISSAGTSNKAYKHGLTLVAESGNKKTELKITLTCDATLTACRAHIHAERPAMADFDKNSEDQWKMDLKCDYLLPENLKKTAHNQFIAVINGKWGQQLEQHIVAHISAKPQQQFPQELALFINDFSVSADYKITKTTQAYFQRVYAMFQSTYYFQSEVLNNNDEKLSKQNQVRARLAIEPYTRRAVNVTIQTPQELFRLENIPSWKLGFWVQQQQRRPAYHSITSMVHRAVDETRSECRVLSNDFVRTFASNEIRAPLSHRCFTVLAKDCQNTGEPQFVVMAKKQTSESRNANKIVKIITPDFTLEARPASQDRQVEQIKLFWNGEEVKPYQQSMENVEFDGEELYARLDGVSVRFDGQKLSVKVSQEFSQAQCGLCGELNADSEDTYRTASNKRTNSVADFHRSYNVRDEECTEEHLNEFYGNEEQRQSRFRSMNRSSRRNQEQQSEESDEWESREYNGPQETESTEQDDEYDYQTGKKQTLTPRQVIDIQEAKNKICFSQKPIQRCDEESYSVEDKENEEERPYSCYSRQSVDGRRLQRLVAKSNKKQQVPALEKLAKKLDIELGHTVSRKVQIHKLCQRA